MKKPLAGILLIVGFVLALAGTAPAATFTIGANTAWSGIAGGPPTSADSIIVSNSATLTMDVANAQCASIQLGAASGTGTGTLLFNSGSQVSVSGTVTVGGGTGRSGSINMGSSCTLIANALAVTTAGTWTPGSGTVQLAANNTLPASFFTSFNNLTVSSGTTTLGASIAVNGLLTQSGGNLAVGANTLTVNASHNAGTNIVSGAGGYTLASGATLASGHTNGIGGNITTTTKTLNAGANYTFNGAVPQVSSATLPATVTNLTINNAAGVTLSQSTTVSGTLTLASGAFALGANTLTLNGAIANSGGSLTGGASANITYGGSGAGTTLPAVTLNNLILNRTNGITLGGATTVGGTLTLTSGAVTSAGNLTLGNNANISRAAGSLDAAPALAGNVNVTYTTGGVTTGPELPTSATALQALNLNIASGIVTLGANATVNAAFTIAAGGTFSDNGFTLTAKSTVANSGTHSSSGGSGEILFAGSTAQSITGIFGNVELNNTAGASIGGTTTINGNLTLTAGTLSVGAVNLTVNGATTVASKLAIITSTTGTKTFNDVTVNGTWTNAINDDVTITGNVVNNGVFAAGTGSYILSGSGKTIGGTLSIANVALNGTYTNNGTWTVGSFNASLGTLTQGANSTLYYAGGNATFDCGLVATAGGNTVDYNLAGAQTVKPTAYHNLVLSASGAKTMTSVTAIGGDLTISGSATMTGNAAFALAGALNYSSSGASTLTAATPISIGAYNQTAGTLVDNGNTITVAGSGPGTWTRSGGSFTATGTVAFTGVAPQFGPANFNNLAINVGSGNSANLAAATTVSATLTLSSGTFDNATYLTLANGATISRAAGVLAVVPTFGTTVNVAYTGSTPVTTGPELPASTSGLGGLTVNNIGGLTLAANTTVNGVLTLTNGDINLDTYQLNLAAPATVSGGNPNSYVIGAVQKSFTTGAGQSFTFPIGDSANYTPIALAAMTVGTAGTLSATSTANDHLDIATSSLDPSQTVNRYWTLTPGGGMAASAYNATFNFVPADLDAGATTAAFAVRRYSGGTWSPVANGTLTATNSQATGLNAFGDFAVGEALGSKLAFTTQPVNTAAGAAMANVVVQVQDSFGTNATTAGVPVSLTLNGNGTLNGTISQNTDASGKATFTGLSIALTGAGNNFTASADGFVSATSANFSITPAAASVVRVEIAADGSGELQPATSIAAGAPLIVYAITRDTYGNFVSNVTATVWAATNRTGGVVAGDLVANGKNATFTGHVAGTATIRATFGAVTTVESGTITVVPGAPAKMFVTLPGQTFTSGSGNAGTVTAQTAGTAFNLVALTATDAYTNLTTSYSGAQAISYAGPGGNPSYTTAVVFENGQSTTTLDTTLTRAETTTITATDGALTGIASSSLTVNRAPFAQLQVLMPGQTAAPGTISGATGTPTDRTAGTAFSVIIRAVDDNWNLVSTNDSVHLTSSDPQATLPGDVALIGGLRTNSVTFKTSGSQTVTASDVTPGHGSIGSATGDAAVVIPAAASKLVISTTPSSTATVGEAFAQQPVIFIQDTYSNIRSNDTLTVTAVRGGGAGTLLGTTNAAAVGGVVTFTNLAHPYATNITIVFTNSTLAAATSGNIAVGPGPLSQLLVLLPGQTSAPGTLTGRSGTPTGQFVGTNFVARITAVDAWWNQLTNVTDTVGLTSSDTNAVLPLDVALINGTNSLTVACKTAGSQTVTANVISADHTTGDSSAVTVNPSAFVKLQLLVPGEIAVPGTVPGKSGPPAPQIAGTPFTVTVNGVDAYWNVQPSASGASYTMRITSSDTNATTPANANLVSGTINMNVTFKSAGSWTVTATDFDNTTLTNVSPAIAVNAGAFARLQLLMPGETTVPGTATGKTGNPFAQTAGVPFTVTVNAVDANWNFVDSAADTVHFTSSDVNGIPPADATLVAGTLTASATCFTAASRTVTATDSSDGSKTASIGTATTIIPAACSQLQVLMPGETTAPGTVTGKTGTANAQPAGTAFNVTVNAVDDYFNLVNTNDTVHLTSTDVNATVAGDAALVGGTKPLSVTFKTVGSQSVTAADVTHPGISQATGATVAVSAGTFAKLQLLVPGETAAPGSPTGKTGTPAAETAGTPFSVTVNAVDANWNPISTNDTIRIYASDTKAVLPANAALIAGSQTFDVTLSTAPSATLTASNVTHSAITRNISPAIPVSAATPVAVRVETKADGTGTVVPVQNLLAGNSITNFAIARDTYGNFAANIAADAWSLASKSGNVADTDLVAAPDNMSAIFTGHGTGAAIIHADSGGLNSTNSGVITVLSGVFTQLQLLMPGEIAAPGTPTGKDGDPSDQTAGAAFTVTVNAVDANWNVVSTNDTVRVTTTDPNDVLPANTALVAGTRTLTLTNKTAGTWNASASNVTHSAKTTSTSPDYRVNSAAFARIQLLIPGETASPGSATGKTGTPTARTAGAAFDLTVNAVDANWNLVDTVSDQVGITTSDTNAVVPASAALSNGTNLFSLILNTAGTNRTVTATDLADLSKTNTSPNITVNPGAFAQLQVLLPGETAVPGSATGKTGTPTPQTASTGYNVTVRAADAYWNLVSTNDTIHLASSDSNAGLAADAALTSGSRIFSVTNKTAGSQTVTASDVTHPAITANTSSEVTINSGGFVKLQLLAPGETAAPGTPLGKTATPDAQKVGVAFDVSVSSVDANWNLISTNDTVHITSSDTQALLPPDAALANGQQSFSVTFATAGNRTVSVGDLSHTNISSATSASISVAKGDQTISFGALPGKNYGDAPFAVNATASSGLPVGFEIVSGPASVIASTVALTGAGTVTVRALQAGDSNWNPASSVDQSFHVAVAPLVVSADSQSRAYGMANPPLTASYLGLVNGDTANAISGAPALSTGAETNSPTGEYPIEVSVGTLSNANYSFSFTNGILTVTQTVLTVKADDQSRPYGSANAPLTASYSGFVNGQDTNILSGSPELNCAADETTAVGNYSITITQGTLSASDTNYSLAFVNGNLEVTPAALAVTADSFSRAYGAANPLLSGTVAGVLNGDVITAEYNTAAGVTNGVGVYAIVPALTGDALTNYTVLATNGTLTVTPVDLSVTAANQSRAYGAADPLFTGTILGILNGDPITAYYTTTATASSPAGSYDIVPSLSGPLDNYSVSTINGTLTVSAAPLTVRADNQSRGYGSTNALLTVTYDGFANSEGASVLSGAPELSTTANTNSPTGEYAIEVGIGTLSNANYLFSFTNGTLTVTQAVLTIKADDQTRPYGAANPLLTASYIGFVNGHDTNILTGVVNVGCVADSSSPAGNYDITVALGSLAVADTNYSLVLSNGLLQVTPLTITGHITVSNKVYDRTSTATITNRTLSGVLGDDVVTLEGGTATFDTKDVGAGKTVTATGLSLGGTAAGNYVLDPAPVTTTADIAPATVVAHIAAANKGYDGTTAAAITGRTLSGAFSGDVVSLEGGSANFDTKEVGVGKTVTAIGLSLGGADAGDYTLASTTATTTADITAILVTVTGHITAANKSYDGTTTATITDRTLTGVLGSDVVTLEGGTATFDTPAAGTGKTVTATGLSLGGADAANYELSATSVSTAANILPVELSVVAGDNSRAYGSVNPEFTVAYAGFVNGEDTNALSGAPALLTTAETNSPTGLYAIEVGLGTLSSANYSFAFTNGTLTVTQAMLTVKADNQSRAYGAANPPLTASYTGFVNGQDTNILSGSPNLSTSADSSSVVSNYDIIVAQGSLSVSDTNYSLAFVNGTLEITPVTVTGHITADNKVYDQTTDATITSRALSGVLGDDVVTLEGGTAAFDTKDVGTGKAVTATGLSLGGAAAGNYVLDPAPVTTTADIAPATVVAHISAANKGYDGTTAAAITGRTLSGAFSGDVVSLEGGSANFDTKEVGVGKTVTAIGLSLGGADAGDYTLASTTATTTADITAILVTVTGHITAANKSYDGTTTATITDRTLTGVLGSDVVTLEGGTATFDTPAAGTGKTVTATGLSLGGADAANYELSATSVSTAANILPVELSVVAGDNSRAYGSVNPEFTVAYAGFVNSEDTNVLSGAPTLLTTAETNSPTGLYAIEVGLGTLSSANYSFAFTNATLTVTQAVLTAKADDQIRIYGAPNPTLTVTYTGFVNGQDTGILSGSPALSTADSSSSVGGYPITIAQGGLSVSDTNYALAFVNGTLTINRASLLITPDFQFREYGSSNPTLTGLLEGLRDGDAIIASFSTTATPASPVEYYPITVALSDSGDRLGNYNVTTNYADLEIYPVELVIAADAKTRVYGTSNPPLTCTLTGLKNNDNISGVGYAAAGPYNSVGDYTITPQLDDPDSKAGNYWLVYQDGTLTVTRALLTVRGDDKSKVYGAANPPLTVSYSGFADSETISVLSGSPILATDATNSSSVGVYSISVSAGTLSATNYSYSFTNGILTVTPAETALAVSSSANPSPVGSNVTFTAALSHLPPATTPPSGSVQFLVDGSPFGDPALLSSGIATLDTAGLSHGYRSIVVRYAGDDNFNGCTNSLTPNQLVNSAPSTGVMAIIAVENQATNLSLATLLSTCSDPDSDSLTVTSVGASSLQGGTVLLGGPAITYTPPSDYTGPDSFTYTVTDAFGATAGGTVTITVNAAIVPAPVITGLTRQANGSMQIRGAGVAGYTYRLQASTNLLGNWSAINTNAADGAGAVNFTDTDASGYSKRFYRLMAP